MANSTNRQTLPLLLLATTLLASSPTGLRALNATDGAPASVYLPAEPTQVYSIAVDGRRRLGPFQLCLDCKCCPAVNSDPTLCTTLPCCFGIDCALPSKPYGVCAFVPKSCNCTGCGM